MKTKVIVIIGSIQGLIIRYNYNQKSNLCIWAVIFVVVEYLQSNFAYFVLGCMWQVWQLICWAISINKGGRIKSALGRRFKRFMVITQNIYYAKQLVLN